MICTKCCVDKPVIEFPRNRCNKSGYGSWCKECVRVYRRKLHARDPERARSIKRESMYRTGRSRPLGTNSECASYLGVFVAERVLFNVFDRVDRMPTNNPGFDFICGRGYKIDVKSACRRKRGSRSDKWQFGINKNTTADHFLCLAFDNRNNLEPEHVWLLPGKFVSDHVTVSVSESRLSKWSEYELNDKLENVIACCDSLRGRAL